MQHNEAGERLAEGYERTRNAAVTAEAYGVSDQRGREPKMGEEDLQRLKAEIKAHPDKTPGI